MPLFLFYKSLITPGGAERLIIEEYKGYKALGYDVKLVVFNYKIDALFGEDVESDIIKLNTGMWLLAMFRFLKLLLSHRSSVVIASSGAIEVFIACSIAKINYSLHVHHPITMNVDTSKFSFFLRHKYPYILHRTREPEIIEASKVSVARLPYIYISLRQMFDYLSMKSAKCIFVLSDYARDELKYLYGIDAVVIQGAIETVSPDYKKITKMENLVDFNILSLSRLVPQKRIDYGIHAFSKVLKSIPNAKFYIGGRGPEERRLRNLVSHLKISRSVIFLGFVPDDELLDHYSSADLFLSLDWADFNLTVYESISAGTKAVVSEEGDFDSGLMEAGYITKVNPKNSENISQAILEAHFNQCQLTEDEVYSLLMPYTWVEYCQRVADAHGFKLSIGTSP